MKRLLYGVTTAQGAGATSATNALSVINSAGTSLLVIGDDGAVRVGTNSSATTQTTASINASGSGTNIGLALVPKGTGAITAHIPDGTAAGGNARGSYAVDLQMGRSSNLKVASGLYSVIGGGDGNLSSGSSSAICGGSLNTASGQNSFIGGGFSNQATGSFSASLGGQSCWANAQHSTTVGGANIRASATYSIVAGGRSNSSIQSYASVLGGYGGLAYLFAQTAVSSSSFTLTATGDAQTSNIRYLREITGTTSTELFLDGLSSRGILNLPTGATAGRVWNAKIQLIAVCTVQGAGTVTVGEVFGGNYAAIIKRIGSSTSLVGTVQNLHTAQTDTNMATAAVTITADDTNESLKIEFTPPTTAAADTVIRVVATVYLTEVGY